jgi:transcriptional regulator with XRE-family HTH domain
MSSVQENFFYLVAGRLRDERTRLGLSQQAAAAGCHVSREIWGKYERGQVIPGADVLFSFGTLGADVGFILTGQHSETTEEVKRLRRANDAAVRALVIWCGMDIAALAELQSQAFTEGLSVEELVERLGHIVAKDRPGPASPAYGAGPARRKADQPAGAYPIAEPDPDLLTDAERRILAHYRRCTEEGKRALEQTGDLLAQAGKRQVKES